MSWPDVEAGVRDYLKADAGVAAIVSTRVFYGVPRGGTGDLAAQLPLITVRQVGGVEDPSEAPIEQALVQIDCWGRSHTAAVAVRNAVRDALASIRGATQLNAEVVGYGAQVESVLFTPDPSDVPRYSVTALVTARAA